MAIKKNYKTIPAIFGMGLTNKGTVVVPSYTLFPHGTVEHMVFDIYKIVQWTHANIQ